ncbi:hypothetical protein HRbin40_00647 [bacterium HR40]|nr:hypothetical protein HRbin40_00647 [bacterium HR40]
MGAASEVPLQVAYRPPENPAARPRTVRPDAPVAEALRRAAERLAPSGFVVVRRELSPALLELRYAGDPDPWLDCGQIAPADGNEGWQPVAVPWLRLVGTNGERLVRTLYLEAIVRVTGRTAGTEGLGIRVAYRLAATADRIDRDRRVIPEASESASFETGGVGVLGRLGRCVANGALEATVARALAESRGSIRPTASQ